MSGMARPVHPSGRRELQAVADRPARAAPDLGGSLVPQRSSAHHGETTGGLLLYPEFPASSFWSYRHIMPMVGAKAAFPPLGLLTFAALMPDEWSFELLDLNVDRPSDVALRRRIASADAVFVSAMSVQKRSLVEV